MQLTLTRMMGGGNDLDVKLGSIPGWVKLLAWFKLPGETLMDVKKAAEGLSDDDKRAMVEQAVKEGVISV